MERWQAVVGDNINDIIEHPEGINIPLSTYDSSWDGMVSVSVKYENKDILYFNNKVASMVLQGLQRAAFASFVHLSYTAPDSDLWNAAHKVSSIPNGVSTEISMTDLINMLGYSVNANAKTKIVSVLKSLAFASLRVTFPDNAGVERHIEAILFSEISMEKTPRPFDYIISYTLSEPFMEALFGSFALGRFPSFLFPVNVLSSAQSTRLLSLLYARAAETFSDQDETEVKQAENIVVDSETIKSAIGISGGETIQSMRAAIHPLINKLIETGTLADVRIKSFSKSLWSLIFAPGKKFYEMLVVGAVDDLISNSFDESLQTKLRAWTAQKVIESQEDAGMLPKNSDIANAIRILGGTVFYEMYHTQLQFEGLAKVKNASSWYSSLDQEKKVRFFNYMKEIVEIVDPALASALVKDENSGNGNLSLSSIIISRFFPTYRATFAPALEILPERKKVLVISNGHKTL